MLPDGRIHKTSYYMVIILNLALFDGRMQKNVKRRVKSDIPEEAKC
jgi:hypothetical protein